MTELAWHIAQLNVGRLLAPPESPVVADFMASLDRINRLAEASPGFVWRLKSDTGNATDIRVGDDDPQFIINMSVWASVETLFDFVYRTAHTQVMVRRRQWFERPDVAYQVLWWVPAGYRPTPEEALARLAYLREHGSTPWAFAFKQRYAPPQSAGAPTDMQPEPYCVGWR